MPERLAVRVSRLQIAASYCLPVAFSHAIVGAIAGFSWVAAGISALDWVNLGRISIHNIKSVISFYFQINFSLLLNLIIANLLRIFSTSRRDCVI